MNHYSFSGKQTAIALVFIFPFAGLIYSLSHWRESWAKNAFWIACVYLGAVFIYWPEGTILGMGADGGRYALDLINMHSDRTDFWSILTRYRIERNSLDIYQILVTYLISRFTDNGHILFAVFAFVFGFFYSRNIWYILDKLPNKRLGSVVVLIALFFLICPITQINGVRMWTALHIFIYALMPYVLENDKSRIWWLVTTPFVHFSFLYVALFAGAFILLIPERIKTSSKMFVLVSLVIFVASLFFNSLNFTSVGAVLEEYSPDAYEERIDMYVDEDLANRKAEAIAQANWYVGVSGVIKNWSYSILLIVLFSCIMKNYKISAQVKKMYAFTLLFSALANIMARIPSGGRFQLVAQMFIVALFIIVAVNVPKTELFNRLLNISYIFLLIPLVVSFRVLFDFFSITAIAGNFFTLFFWENNVPLISLIK